MHTKSKLTRQAAQGLFVRSLGWQLKGGKRHQPKFYLGKDEAAARIANWRLEAMWKRIEDSGEPYWDETTLEIGKAIARGATRFEVVPNPAMTGAESYVHWVERLALQFGDIIQVVPQQEEEYRQGHAEMREQRERKLQWVDVAYPEMPSVAAPAKVAPHETLHHALEEYIENLKKSQDDASGWGRVKVKQGKALLDHHKNMPLLQMELHAMQDMVDYWRRRPKVKDRDRQMSALTVRNQIKQLKDFWRWLHHNKNYSWRKPDGVEDMQTKINLNGQDWSARLKTLQVSTFTVEELVILYRHATPLVRCFILLGLNCGFSIAEIGSLTAGEIHLFEKHPEADRLDFASSDRDSWIRRVRGKSGVYGEWKLWQPTVEALRWALDRKQGIGGEGQTLLVSSRGEPLIAPTKSGNKSSRIPNLWNNLYRTVHKEHPSVRKLAIKYLRKTGGDLVRRFSDGEVAGVFLCHGTPVKTDALADIYTNRPFARVFAALDRVEQHLKPLFPDTEKKL